MKARRYFPYALALLLLLAAACLFFWGKGPETLSKPGTQAAKPAPALLPATNTSVAPNAPDFTGKNVPDSMRGRPGTGPLTAVLAAPGADPTAREQAPPQTWQMSPALNRIRPARITDLAGLQDPNREPGKHESTRRFQFDLFPGLSLTATSHTLENLPLRDGDTIRGLYTGTIDNVPGSVFTIAYNGDAMSASIIAGGYGRYTIQPAPGGWYRVTDAKVDNPDFCTASIEKSLAAAAKHGFAAGDVAGPDGQHHNSDLLPTYAGPKAATASNPVTYKLYAVYSDDIASDYGGEQNLRPVIDSQFGVVNQGYANSNVYVRADLVAREKMDYDETGSLEADLDAITDIDGILDNIHTRRNQLQADIVTFFVKGVEQGGTIGIGWVTSDNNMDYFGFNVVRPQYDPQTWVHEIGHNMGCNHNVEDAGGGLRRFPYSYGYRLEIGDTLYISIMAYPPFSDPDQEYFELLAFSNPDYELFGIPFGVDANDNTGRDNARTHNETGGDIASFRPKVGVVLPPAPTNVQASDGTYASAVLIQWNASAGAVNYGVYRSETGSTNNAIFLSGTNAALSYEDVTASPGVVYTYYVRAVDNDFNFSNFSVGNTGYARAPRLSGMSANSVAASDGSDALYVRVTYPSIPNAAGYVIYRNIDPTILGSVMFTARYPTEFKDTTAQPGVQYNYWVQAYGSGVDEYSAIGGPDKGWMKAPPDVGRINSLNATTSFPNSVVNLTWPAASDAAQYEVARTTDARDTGGSSPVIYRSPYAIVNHVDKTSEPGTTYYYFVRGINAKGAGPWSPRATITLPSEKILPAPKNVKASNGEEDFRITVRWDKVNDTSDAKVNGYSIYRSTTNDEATAVFLDGVGPSLLEFRDYGYDLPEGKLQADVIYYYWVRTRNLSGALSIFSNSDPGHIKPPPPSIPIGVQASNGLYLDYVEVTWAPAHGAATYEIFRGTNQGNPDVKVGEVPASVLIFRDTGAQIGKTYWYAVRSKNSLGTTSDKSVTDSGYRQDPLTVGPPLTPTGLTASNDEVARIVIKWTGSQNSSRYHLYRNALNSAVGGTLIKTTEGTVFIDEDVLPLVTWYYYVIAESAAGVSPPSNVDAGQAQYPAPAELQVTLDDASIPFESPSGTKVGTFTTTPVVPASRTFNYFLIPGDGSEDNNLFNIVGNELFTAFVPGDEEENGDTKRIRVRVVANDDPYVYTEVILIITIEPEQTGGTGGPDGGGGSGPGGGAPGGSPIAAAQYHPASNALNLTWASMSGTWFQVQKNTTMDAAGWENVGAPTQDRHANITLVPGEPQCFYRVINVSAP